MPPRYEAPSPLTGPCWARRIRDDNRPACLIACMLNFLQSQADVALDPHAAAGTPPARRRCRTSRHPCPPARTRLIAQLIDLAAPHQLNHHPTPAAYTRPSGKPQQYRRDASTRDLRVTASH